MFLNRPLTTVVGAVPLLLVLALERLGAVVGAASAPLAAAMPPALPPPSVVAVAPAATAAAAPGRRQLLAEVAEGPRDGRRVRHGLGPGSAY